MEGIVLESTICALKQRAITEVCVAIPCSCKNREIPEAKQGNIREEQGKGRCLQGKSQPQREYLR